MTLLRGQADVSAQVPMPVDSISAASTSADITTATLTWFYVASTTFTSATGQAAGTIVVGKLGYNKILNAIKSAIGSFNDTSLSLGATTRFNALVSCPEATLSQLQFMSPSDQAALVTPFLVTQGNYIIDHRRGMIWGKARATVANDTASYSYWQGTSGAAGDISTVGSVAIPTSGADGVSNTQSGVPTYSRIEGYNGSTWDRIQVDSNKYLKVAEQYAPVAEDNTLGVFAMLPKPAASSTYSPSLFKNLGANATLNIKPSTGNILSIYARNVSGSDRWIQLHNTATVPAGAAVPVFSFYVPAGGVTERGTEFFTQAGVNGSNGWAFACSTTEGTYTAATATDHFTYIQYI